jgi:hypothetical protein
MRVARVNETYALGDTYRIWPISDTHLGSADVDEDTPAPVKSAPVATSSPFDDGDDAPAATAPVASTKPTQKAEDILAMIRARQKQ